MKYEVVYNSDVVLGYRANLATYCIFYDKVLLPYTSSGTVPHMLQYRRPTGSTDAPTLEGYDTEWMESRAGKVRMYAGSDVVGWERENRVLFDAGVLSRLPPPQVAIDWDNLLEMPLTAGLENMVAMMEGVVQTETERDTFIYFRQDLVAHLLRTDIAQPQIFVSRSVQPVREILKACEAESVFQYLLPRIALAQPDQILEVREKVKDTREGFSMHLQKLSEGLESKLKGGEDLSDIRNFAQSMIETKLIPDYREYVRQIRAEKAGFWGKVLDPVTKILQIDAAPWTPKFYGEFIKSLGFGALAAASEKKSRLSNASQAYQFMHGVEKHLRQLS